MKEISLHIPEWMDEELILLSRETGLSKNRLMRLMVFCQLESAWIELSEDYDIHMLGFEKDLLKRTSIDENAKDFMMQKYGIKI